MTTTWRDIADHLTPAQIAEMEEWESLHPDEQKYLMVEARSYAEDNLIGAVMFPHIAAPPDAQGTPFSWIEGPAGRWSREFEGTAREPLRDFAVNLSGRQFSDGNVVRFACVRSADRESRTTGELRAAAAALLEAADELDRLNDMDGIADVHPTPGS